MILSQSRFLKSSGAGRSVKQPGNLLESTIAVQTAPGRVAPTAGLSEAPESADEQIEAAWGWFGCAQACINGPLLA